MRDWNNDIFARLDQGFAAYIEPNFERLKPRCHRKSYSEWTPSTVGGAKNLFDHIPEQREWAIQLESGSWSWQIQDRNRKMKGREVPGRGLEVFDLVKHLCGRSFAVGTTNRPWTGRGAPSPVKFLRIDVDNDAWMYALDPSMVEELWISLDRHAGFLGEAGIPYTVFRTGRRGVQYIFPLPIEIPHDAASIIVAALRAGLRRAQGTDFKSDLEGILRLPLGLHAKSGNLGAFIDVGNRRLFDLEGQRVELTKSFLPSELSEGFEDFVNEIGTTTPNKLLSDSKGLMKLISSKNPFAQRLLSLLPHRQFQLQVGAPNQASAASNISCESSEPKHLNLGVQDKSWAQGVWNMPVHQGQFWEWLRRGSGGHGGIRAARLLFGPKLYEANLIQKAHSVPHASDRDLQDRIYAIQSLVRNYSTSADRKDAVQSQARLEAPSQAITERSKQLVAEIPRQPHARWSFDLAEKALSLILEAISQSPKRIASASIVMVSEGLDRVWGANPSRSAVATILRVLDAGGVIIRQPQGRKISLPDKWTLG
jgi:hypothetical protein